MHAHEIHVCHVVSALALALAAGVFMLGAGWELYVETCLACISLQVA